MIWINSLAQSFDSISFDHIYRDFSTDPDVLSKIALDLQIGSTKFSLCKKDRVIEIDFIKLL